MRAILEFLIGMLFSLLPPRYRRDRDFRMEALASSLVQGFAASLLLTYRFMIFSWQRAGIIGNPVDTPSNLPEVNATVGGGVFMMAEFVMNPLHLMLLYFFYEAVIRFGAAYISHQVLGSLPLYVVGGIHGLFHRQAHRRYMGGLIEDEVVRSTGGITVRSCRPKLHWNPYMTVEYQGEFFQPIREEPGTTPRRFTYYLRKNPTGRIVVTIDHYTPSDVFKPREREVSAWKQVQEDLSKKLKRDAPLVEDLLVRGSTRQDYDLKIYSCRPKTDWNSYVAIEFEDEFYELFRQERGEAPRGFVYFLRKAPTNKPASVVRHYSANAAIK